MEVESGVPLTFSFRPSLHRGLVTRGMSHSAVPAVTTHLGGGGLASRLHATEALSSLCEIPDNDYGGCD